MECLIAAIRAGADAVYLGHQNLSARRNAENFDDEQLVQGVKICKAQDKKVYLTLNTIVKEDEIETCYNVLVSAAKAGVTGIIVQDLAVARIIKEFFPHFEIHGSTQMSISTPQDFLFLQNYGFSRAVVPREASIDEIMNISKQSDIELEVFVHGALCMCFSGQCYLSSIIGSRSGNRGLCAQPCRLKFRNGENSNVLSLKDLNLINHVKDLTQSGVASLKIEGRMKRPEYVATASQAYKMALNGEKVDENSLKAIFSRSGFTNAYLDSKLSGEMFGIREKGDVVSAAQVLKPLRSLYNKPLSSVKINAKLIALENKPSELFFTDQEGNNVSSIGEIPQVALNKPMTADSAKESISKLGGTPFYLCEFDAQISDGVMLPAKDINALRR
ncbi:MAG: U32 family peptidase, partial [Oscillospiraceae bacterium]